jgi:hypothetical protein
VISRTCDWLLTDHALAAPLAGRGGSSISRTAAENNAILDVAMARMTRNASAFNPTSGGAARIPPAADLYSKFTA